MRRAAYWLVIAALLLASASRGLADSGAGAASSAAHVPLMHKINGLISAAAANHALPPISQEAASCRTLARPPLPSSEVRPISYNVLSVPLLPASQAAPQSFSANLFLPTLHAHVELLPITVELPVGGRAFAQISPEKSRGTAAGRRYERHRSVSGSGIFQRESFYQSLC